MHKEDLSIYHSSRKQALPLEQKAGVPARRVALGDSSISGCAIAVSDDGFCAVRSVLRSTHFLKSQFTGSIFCPWPAYRWPLLSLARLQMASSVPG